jgi:hypothetical protein
MSMSNAVRVGTQYALVHHPSVYQPSGFDPNTDAQGTGIVTLTDVRARVIDAADFLDKKDPGGDLTVTWTCLCPDGSTIACPTSSTPPTCASGNWQAAVNIQLQHNYPLLLRYPGMGDTLTLRASNLVRLN